MGIRYEGPICSSCKTLIEGPNFFTCHTCQSVIHRNEHCKNIHQMSCLGSRFRKRPIPDFDRNPDVTDIFK